MSDTRDLLATRILMCGELAKQGQMVGGWKNRFFQLTPNELQYYEKEVCSLSNIFFGQAWRFLITLC